MTALAEALANAGFDQFEHQAKTIAANWIKAGGTREKWLAIFDAAERMSGMGQVAGAEMARVGTARSRQQVEGGVAAGIVPNLKVASPPSFNRGGGGQTIYASSRQVTDAIPAREPKPQRAAIDFGAASVAIKTKLAQSALDRVHTSDGRPWGDVGAHELDGMGRDGALAQALKNHLGSLSNTQRFKTIRDLVNPETFEAIRSKIHHGA